MSLENQNSLGTDRILLVVDTKKKKREVIEMYQTKVGKKFFKESQKIE
jgi:hypothetical protein